MPIIKSLMDTDFYTLTMAQLMFHRYANTTGTYKYKCRSKNSNGIPSVTTADHYLGQFNDELDAFCSLKFTEPELDTLKATGLFQDSFLSFLRQLKLDRNAVEIGTDASGGLSIRISGDILNGIWFEVPSLAINSELNSRAHNTLFERGFKMAEERLEDKINFLKKNATDDFNFVDFGTRRRYCALLHDRIIERLTQPDIPEGMFAGTSNCMLAMKYGIPMKGTMAHQLFQIFQALVGPEQSVFATLEAWLKEYHGELGIALSDIFGFDHFLRCFGARYATPFAGVRHDSGNPYKWCEQLIHHYQQRNISPITKTAVFSDGLDFQTAIYLYKAFRRQIQISFGIGTNLTNDTGLIDALQIVIKLIEVNGLPVAKIADDSGKGMCENPAYIEYIKHVCNL